LRRLTIQAVELRDKVADDVGVLGFDVVADEKRFQELLDRLLRMERRGPDSPRGRLKNVDRATVVLR
jgi:hypothetical protein